MWHGVAETANRWNTKAPSVRLRLPVEIPLLRAPRLRAVQQLTRIRAPAHIAPARPRAVRLVRPVKFVLVAALVDATVPRDLL
jgi:hypothetical protein